MKQVSHFDIEGLLIDADAAADEKCNGLMDRADFQQIISRLAQTTRELREECEFLQQERDSYASRLDRKPHVGAFETRADYKQAGIQSF